MKEVVRGGVKNERIGVKYNKEKHWRVSEGKRVNPSRNNIVRKEERNANTLDIVCTPLSTTCLLSLSTSFLFPPCVHYAPLLISSFPPCVHYAPLLITSHFLSLYSTCWPWCMCTSEEHDCQLNTTTGATSLPLCEFHHQLSLTYTI